MNAVTRHSLVKACLVSGFSVMEKQASVTPEQSEVLAHAWPAENEGLSKLATLSKVIATGVMIEEADAG